MLCTTDFPPALGGIAKYSHELALHFQKLDESIEILCSKTTGWNAFDEKQPFNVYRTPKMALLREAFFTKCLFSLVSRTRPDRVFCTLWYPAGVCANIVCKQRSLPYFLSVYGSETLFSSVNLKQRLKSKLGFLRNKALQEATKIIAISNYTKKRLLELGVPESKVMVIPGGVDVAFFKPRSPKPKKVANFSLHGKKVLLTVTRLENYKGVDTVLKALPELIQKFPDIIYLVVGRGPEEQTLKNLSRSLGIEHSVIFTGALTPEELVRAYQSCDVFVLDTRHIPGRDDTVEGFGLVFLEAGACGKPVVAGDNGGVRDAVLHEKTGLLVNPHRTEPLVEAVIHLLSNPSLCENLGQAGRKRVETEFTWERVARQILDVMNKHS